MKCRYFSAHCIKTGKKESCKYANVSYVNEPNKLKNEKSKITIFVTQLKTDELQYEQVSLHEKSE